MLQLEPGVSLRFGVEEPLYLASIRVKKKDLDGNLIPDEKGIRMVKLLEGTNAYIKGFVRYVPSPAEVRLKEKKKLQEKEKEKIKTDLESGLYTIDFSSLSKPNVYELCDRIGVERKDAGGKDVRIDTLKLKIRERIGLSGGTSFGNLEKFSKTIKGKK